MSTMEAYIAHRKRARLHMWFGYLLANAACIGMLAVLWTW